MVKMGYVKDSFLILRRIAATQACSNTPQLITSFEVWTYFWSLHCVFTGVLLSPTHKHTIAFTYVSEVYLIPFKFRVFVGRPASVIRQFYCGRRKKPEMRKRAGKERLSAYCAARKEVEKDKSYGLGKVRTAGRFIGTQAIE